MNKTKSIILIVATILGIIYFFLMSFARNGYGYTGYYGYHRGPSFWYFGGPSTYHSRYVRSGSIGNSGIRGGGPGSGK